MEWLVGPDGRYVRLTPEQAVAIDARATYEDLVVAVQRLRDTIDVSRVALADSRRRRRVRQSALRLVRSQR
jgi:hypothetical protein